MQQTIESLRANHGEDVLLLEGYFDDSGTHEGSDAVTVAGYVSAPELWAELVEEWKEALNEWGLKYFHMTDFANRVKSYADWTDRQRRYRFARLVSIANRHVLASVGFCIPKRSFALIFSKPLKRFVGGAYGIASAACFLEVARLLGPKYPSVRVAYHFEAGTRGADAVLRASEWSRAVPENRDAMKFESLTFCSKEVVPLQCADILAYELYRYVPHKLGLAVRTPPRVENLSMLSDCELKMWGNMDDEGLLQWAQVAAMAQTYHEGGTLRRPKTRRRNQCRS